MDISKEDNQNDNVNSRKGLLLPSFLAFLLGISALYALSLAGNSKPEIKLGQEAYEMIEQKIKVKREKIKLEQKQNTTGENKDTHSH